MSWHDEVEDAAAVILAEFPDVVRDLIADVEIAPVEGYRDEPAWGRFYFRDRRIEVYRAAFDDMPDPENRTIQLRDVIRHEIEHALGEIHPGHSDHDTTIDLPDGWLGHGPLTVEVAGLRIDFPEPV